MCIFRQLIISCKKFYSYLVLGVRFCQATKHACVYFTRLIFESVYFTMIILMRVAFQQQKNYV
jgi:hypothetical protein